MLFIEIMMLKVKRSKLNLINCLYFNKISFDKELYYIDTGVFLRRQIQKLEPTREKNVSFQLFIAHHLLNFSKKFLIKNSYTIASFQIQQLYFKSETYASSLL